MKLVTKKELIEYIWNSCKHDDGAIEWASGKLSDGYKIRLEEEHKNVARIGMLMSHISGHLTGDNTIRTINAAEYINRGEIPEVLVGSDIEKYFSEIFERLNNVSNP
ncbi:hypothetical protein [Microbulbifer sp. GL-2]|uniref:hypothetical protein n=1 Tax=Microbulbifer sp. GL-2 TaxID=2591606 RepID=UPI001163FD07|nr:hypothetical protein [Microbulbifer sp. GL-2]BBM03839.1 hypothetical protein GL2_39130 [Microbulbifer sp. GL-2]